MKLINTNREGCDETLSKTTVRLASLLGALVAMGTLAGCGTPRQVLTSPPANQTYDISAQATAIQNNPNMSGQQKQIQIHDLYLENHQTPPPTQ